MDVELVEREWQRRAEALLLFEERRLRIHKLRVEYPPHFPLNLVEFFFRRGIQGHVETDFEEAFLSLMLVSSGCIKMPTSKTLSRLMMGVNQESVRKRGYEMV